MKLYEPQNIPGVVVFGRNNNSKIRRGEPLILEWNSSADFLCGFNKKPDLSGKACLVGVGVWSRDVGIVLWWKWNSLFPHLESWVSFSATSSSVCCVGRVSLSQDQAEELSVHKYWVFATESGQKGSWPRWPKLSLRNLSLHFCYSHTFVCLEHQSWEDAGSWLSTKLQLPASTHLPSLLPRVPALCPGESVSPQNICSVFPYFLHFKKFILIQIPQGQISVTQFPSSV